MSLESEIARLIDVVEKGFAELLTRDRQSQMAASLCQIEMFAEKRDTAAGIADYEAKAAPVAASPVPAPTPAPEPAPVAAPNGPAKGNGKGPSYDEVVAIAQEVARIKTPPVAIKLINQHGAQKLIEMDPAKYPAFYAAAQVLLGQTDTL